MKMAVIGSGGFLGSRIAACYAGKWKLFTPTHAELDITDRESVARYLEDIRPDVIIQCAAVSDTGACQREPERSRRINVDGSVNVAEAAGCLGIKCILCSSDQVYFGSSVESPHREDEILTPANEYGRQKLEMERRCLEADPDCVLLRLSWMYDGVRRPGEHGSFMDTLLSALKDRRELSFPIHDRRGITHAREVAGNLEKTFRLPGGVYNFGSGNEKNAYEMVKTVLEQTCPDALPLLRENTQAFAEKPRNLSMNGEKAGGRGIWFRDTADGISQTLKEIVDF